MVTPSALTVLGGALSSLWNAMGLSHVKIHAVLGDTVFFSLLYLQANLEHSKVYSGTKVLPERYFVLAGP